MNLLMMLVGVWLAIDGLGSLAISDSHEYLHPLLQLGRVIRFNIGMIFVCVSFL